MRQLIIKVIFSLIAIFMYTAAFAEDQNVIVYNNTDHPIRAGINDPDPNTGKIIQPQSNATITVPDDKYTVTVCWADQDRTNHCMCKRQSCGNSPSRVLVKGSVDWDCQDDTLQLRCLS